MDLFSATFIVRLDRSGSGPWSGVVERVRTGEKRRVGDIETIGQVIAQMASTEGPQETMNNCQNTAETRTADSDSTYDAKG
jgi:hypothetical protein